MNIERMKAVSKRIRETPYLSELDMEDDMEDDSDWERSLPGSNGPCQRI